jgi:hypothetical protein
MKRVTLVGWLCAIGGYVAADFMASVFYGRLYAEYGGMASLGIARVALPIAGALLGGWIGMRIEGRTPGFLAIVVAGVAAIVATFAWALLARPLTRVTGPLIWYLNAPVVGYAVALTLQREFDWFAEGTWLTENRIWLAAWMAATVAGYAAAFALGAAGGALTYDPYGGGFGPNLTALAGVVVGAVIGGVGGPVLATWGCWKLLASQPAPGRSLVLATIAAAVMLVAFGIAGAAQPSGILLRISPLFIAAAAVLAFRHGVGE